MTATWTQPHTWSTGEFATAANMNTYIRDDMDWLKTPTESGRVQFAADFTTTSVTYTDLTGATTSITTNGGGLDLYFRGMVSNSSSSNTSFQVMVDGVSACLLGTHYNGTTSGSFCMLFEHIAAISAGSHTIKIQVKTSAGTTTVKGTTAATNDPLFYVVERGS